MVEFVDLLNIPIQLLYYAPYHSKYNPIEGCWGILDQHWNGGAKLVYVEVMLSWASSMTWKGLYPILSLSKTVYQKGISLTKKAMKQVESRLQRNPLLPKWDILIQPLQLVIFFSKITLILIVLMLHHHDLFHNPHVHEMNLNPSGSCPFSLQIYLLLIVGLG